MPNKNKLSTDSFGSVIHTPFVWVKRNLGAMVALALMCILLSVTTDSFLVSTNILSTLRNVCVNCLIAFGITCVLICGGIDLSVGSVAAGSRCNGGTACQSWAASHCMRACGSASWRCGWLCKRSGSGQHGPSAFYHYAFHADYGARYQLHSDRRTALSV